MAGSVVAVIAVGCALKATKKKKNENKTAEFPIDGGFSDFENTDGCLTPNYAMHLLKIICLTIVELAKQAWSFPETVAANFRKRRRRTEVNEMEVERLDRIRHPSKYLGKEG
jgi:hypothetical protein